MTLLPSEADIQKLMGSEAYRNSTHRDHTKIQSLVRNWFIKKYNQKSDDADTATQALWENLGNILLVGEGNLSFARSILNISALVISDMTATTYEDKKSLSHEAKINAAHLQQTGAIVIHGIDATKLADEFNGQKFDTIIFQFPHVGSRDPKYGHNPNHILVRRFLSSVVDILNPSGQVLISSVDTPHYEGAFQFEEAAKFAGYETPTIFPFDPEDFPGYVHANTNDDKSALDNHTKFSTWMFRLKK